MTVGEVCGGNEIVGGVEWDFLCVYDILDLCACRLFFCGRDSGLNG